MKRIITLLSISLLLVFGNVTVTFGMDGRAPASIPRNLKFYEYPNHEYPNQGYLLARYGSMVILYDRHEDRLYDFVFDQKVIGFVGIYKLMYRIPQIDNVVVRLQNGSLCLIKLGKKKKCEVREPATVLRNLLDVDLTKVRLPFVVSPDGRYLARVFGKKSTEGALLVLKNDGSPFCRKINFPREGLPARDKKPRFTRDSKLVELWKIWPKDGRERCLHRYLIEVAGEGNEALVRMHICPERIESGDICGLVNKSEAGLRSHRTMHKKRRKKLASAATAGSRAAERRPKKRKKKRRKRSVAVRVPGIPSESGRARVGVVAPSAVPALPPRVILPAVLIRALLENLLQEAHKVHREAMSLKRRYDRLSISPADSAGPVLGLAEEVVVIRQEYEKARQKLIELSRKSKSLNDLLKQRGGDEVRPSAPEVDRSRAEARTRILPPIGTIMADALRPATESVPLPPIRSGRVGDQVVLPRISEILRAPEAARVAPAAQAPVVVPDRARDEDAIDRAAADVVRGPLTGIRRPRVLSAEEEIRLRREIELPPKKRRRLR